jgi:hypothetical protein
MIGYNPTNYLKINTLYAWISIDEYGNEGVLGAKTEHGWMPLVGADQDRIESFRPLAKEIAARGRREGFQVRLIKMDSRWDVEAL